MVVIGTGLAARVIADALTEPDYALVGFLYTGDAPPEDFPYPVLGKFDEAENFAADGRSFIVAEENLKAREALMNALPLLDFQPVIHPAAYVARNVRVGPCAYIGAGAIVGTDAIISGCTYIGEGAIVGATSQIAPYCQIQSRVNIGSGVLVEPRCFIGQSATLKDNITIAGGTVIQTGEIVVKDMVMKMVYKRGAWIYKENGIPEK